MKLNVNIYALMITVLFSSSTFSSEVATFDIKGIKIGMSKKDLLKKIPCQWTYINRSDTDNYFECYTDAKIGVFLDHEDLVYGVDFQKIFYEKPDFNVIRSRILKKYGKPTLQRNHKMSDSLSNQYCWGQCKVNNSAYWIYQNKEGKVSMIVDVLNSYKQHETKSRLSLKLMDGVRAKKYDSYKKREKELDKQKASKKSSSVDF